MKNNIVQRLLERARAHLTNDEYSEAQKIYSDILFAKPNNTDALLGVGVVAKKLKRTDLALSFFSKVIAIDGQHEDALFQRGRAHIKAKNFEQAAEDLTSTLKINPANIDALNSRGIANSQLSNFIYAVQDFEKAIQICSSNADLFYNRGLAHFNLKDYQAAIHDYTYAIKLRPDFYQAFNNRGSAYKELADFKMALKDFKTSTTLKSDFADGYWNQSLIYLMNGEYEKAWPLYEYRWKSKHFPSEKRNFSEPLWLGNQSIEGKTILIHSEQGLGDTIHFCRYIKLLKQKKCKILLEVEKPLFNLMGCLLPKENIFQKGHTLPKFDFHCPLVSLPLVFETNVNSVPFPTPYLKADHSRVTWWRTHLGNSMKPRVGLCWRGNPQHPNDKRRSIALSDIIGTLGSEVDWLSLQYEIDDQEYNVLKKSQKIRHFGSLIGDFAETAAFCKNLDAIVCVDTSIAHLAGALGLTTYLMLSELPDARWQIAGTHTPWYNSVKLFRLKKNQDYSELLIKIQAECASQRIA